MSARILDVCDAVVSTIAAAWTPTGADDVSREYGPEVGLMGSEDVPALDGRQVYVFPSSYGAPEFIDRGCLKKTFAVAVLIVERYVGTDEAPRPPRAWMDDRIAFVQDKVFAVLRNPNLELLDSLVPDPETPGTVDVVYDLDIFVQHKAFWSAATFTFTEGEEF